MTQSTNSNRLTRLMRLYNQCLEDKLINKVRQAEYLIIKIREQDLRNEIQQLEIERAKQSIKHLKLNTIR